MDFLVGLVAVLNAVIEMIGASWAVKAEDPNNMDWVKPEKPCVTDKEAEKQRLLKEAALAEKRRKMELYRKQPIIYKRSDLVSKQKEPEKKDPLAEWIFKHDKLILSCIESGKHLIPNKDLNGVNKDSLADFMFKQTNIESVQIIKDGIEIIAR